MQHWRWKRWPHLVTAAGLSTRENSSRQTQHSASASSGSRVRSIEEEALAGVFVTGADKDGEDGEALTASPPWAFPSSAPAHLSLPTPARGSSGASAASRGDEEGEATTSSSPVFFFFSSKPSRPFCLAAALPTAPPASSSSRSIENKSSEAAVTATGGVREREEEGDEGSGETASIEQEWIGFALLLFHCFPCFVNETRSAEARDAQSKRLKTRHEHWRKERGRERREVGGARET